MWDNVCDVSASAWHIVGGQEKWAILPGKQTRGLSEERTRDKWEKVQDLGSSSF